MHLTLRQLLLIVSLFTLGVVQSSDTVKRESREDWFKTLDSIEALVLQRLYWTSLAIETQAAQKLLSLSKSIPSEDKIYPLSSLIVMNRAALIKNPEILQVWKLALLEAIPLMRSLPSIDGTVLADYADHLLKSPSPLESITQRQHLESLYIKYRKRLHPIARVALLLQLQSIAGNWNDSAKELDYVLEAREEVERIPSNLYARRLLTQFNLIELARYMKNKELEQQAFKNTRDLAEKLPQITKDFSVVIDSNEANSHIDKSDWKRSQFLYERALINSEHQEYFRSRHALILSNYADLLIQQNNFDQAEVVAAIGLLWSQLYGSNDISNLALLNRGQARLHLGWIQAGLDDIELALSMEKFRGSKKSNSENLAKNVNPSDYFTWMLESAQHLEAIGLWEHAWNYYQRSNTWSQINNALMTDLQMLETYEKHEKINRSNQIDKLQQKLNDLNQIKSRDEIAEKSMIFFFSITIITFVIALHLWRRQKQQHAVSLKLKAQLEQLARHDPLTGCINRHGLQEYITRNQFANWHGTIISVDIDHFKSINDRYGHAAGDRVLFEVARRIKSNMRRDDWVIRLGGEEFLILAPELSQRDTSAVVQRLLLSISEPNFAIDQGSLRVTASFGYVYVAGNNQPTKPVLVSWLNAFKGLDVALYQAKHQGRNRAIDLASLPDSWITA